MPGWEPRTSRKVICLLKIPSESGCKDKDWAPPFKSKQTNPEKGRKGGCKGVPGQSKPKFLGFMAPMFRATSIC